MNCKAGPTLDNYPCLLYTSSNKRTIYKFIHQGGIQSCQLVMGLTALEPGNVWNSFPPHTHWRRTEVYLYFDLGDNCLLYTSRCV